MGESRNLDPPSSLVHTSLLLARQRISMSALAAGECPIVEAPKMLRMCSWCRRVNIWREQWVTAGVAEQLIGSQPFAEDGQITHGMCPSCSEKIESDLDRLFPKEKSG